MTDARTISLSDVQARPVVTPEHIGKRVVLAYPHVGKWVGKLQNVFDHPNQAGVTVHRVLIGNTAQNLVGFSPRPLEDGEEFIIPTLTDSDLTESMVNSGAFVAAKSLKPRSEKAVKEAAAPKEVVTRYCASGSGNMTRGGAFAPGGDAKLKSLLLKVERGTEPVSAIADISREYILATPHWAERWAHLFEDGFTPTPVVKTVKPRKPAAAKANLAEGPVVEDAPDDEEFVEETDVTEDFEDDEDAFTEDEDLEDQEEFEDEDESDEDDE